ncbi:hypothetical protein KP509_1Z313600 [Ceratopteris richardii]|nr:hypothetical protein KP509_1Z313600 [Ceratopteris richardii]
MKGNDCEDMGTNHKFIGTQFKEKEIKTRGIPRMITTSFHLAVENDFELLIKEKQRRQRLIASNIGKVAWNKGREMSEDIVL